MVEETIYINCAKVASDPATQFLSKTLDEMLTHSKKFPKPIAYSLLRTALENTKTDEEVLNLMTGMSLALTLMHGTDTDHFETEDLKQMLEFERKAHFKFLTAKLHFLKQVSIVYSEEMGGFAVKLLKKDEEKKVKHDGRTKSARIKDF